MSIFIKNRIGLRKRRIEKVRKLLRTQFVSSNGPILHELTLRDVLLLQKFVDYKLMAKSQLYFALVVNRLSMHF